jgi:hypothetical protein
MIEAENSSPKPPSQDNVPVSESDEEVEDEVSEEEYQVTLVNLPLLPNVYRKKETENERKRRNVGRKRPMKNVKRSRTSETTNLECLSACDTHK